VRRGREIDMSIINEVAERRSRDEAIGAL